MRTTIRQILKKISLPILKGFRSILGVDRIYQSSLYLNSEDIPLHVSYCLILGAKLFEDGALTPMLKKRLNAAIELYEKRPTITFILSGDGSKSFNNDVSEMYTYLRKHSDIPEEQIILDPKGYSTLDSLLHVTEEIDRAGFILLTSAFHMPRSVYLCHRLGLHPYALDLPETSSEYTTHYINRELLALVKNWCIITFGKFPH